MSYAALALSAGSLVIAGLSYRAGGPRLRLQSRRVPADAVGTQFPSGVPVRLTVVNSGRAAVTVEEFHVTYPARGESGRFGRAAFWARTRQGVLLRVIVWLPEPPRVSAVG